MLNEITIAIITGVIVFALSQIVKDFFLAPIIKQRALIEQISSSLSFFANLYTNFPQNSEQETTDRQNMYLEFRNLAVQLVSNANLLPFYNIFSDCKLIPKKENIFKAKQELIGLSNGSWPQNHDHIKINDSRVQKLTKLLNIEL